VDAIAWQQFAACDVARAGGLAAAGANCFSLRSQIRDQGAHGVTIRGVFWGFGVKIRGERGHSGQIPRLVRAAGDTRSG
jgi:hypothetical protein